MAVIKVATSCGFRHVPTGAAWISESNRRVRELLHDAGFEVMDLTDAVVVVGVIGDRPSADVDTELNRLLGQGPGGK